MNSCSLHALEQVLLQIVALLERDKIAATNSNAGCVR